MAKRKLSDYSIFMSARMRALAPHGREEARSAMRHVAAEWRAMQGHRSNPEPAERYARFDDEPRPARRRRRPYARRNPGGPKLLPLAIAGVALWWFFGRAKTPTTVVTVKA